MAHSATRINLVRPSDVRIKPKSSVLTAKQELNFISVSLAGNL
jgi:hypothetical protein